MFAKLLFACALFYGCQADWVQIWSEEFEGDGLPNGDQWTYQVGGGGWGNNELEYYTDNRAENARVEGGHLVITARVEDFGGRQFTSSRMNSRQAWTYGRFEARAKLPAGRQLWPAIWMMPRDSVYGGWAASGEIDIMESRGETPTVTQGTIHYGGAAPNNINSGSGAVDTGVDLTADFHNYILEWDQNTIRWIFDDWEMHTENINRNMWSGQGNNPYDHNGAPFDQAFYWILNIAVGGNFFWGQDPIGPDEARGWAKPTMEIDYLRVFQWQ